MEKFGCNCSADFQIWVCRGAKNEGLCPCPPLKPFLKEGFKNPKNFQKVIFVNMFFKVLERRAAFSSLPDKLQFEHFKKASVRVSSKT